jgi:hypothetical protein
VEPDRVCDHEQTEDDEVHVLHPAAWPGRQSADRERHLTVVWVQQALHDDEHHEHERAGDACGSQCNNHRATFQDAVGSYLSHLHSMFSFLTLCAW